MKRPKQPGGTHRGLPQGALAQKPWPIDADGADGAEGGDGADGADGPLIRRAAREWLAAVDLVSEGVALVASGRILRCNRAFAARFRLDVKQVRDTPIDEVLRFLLGSVEFGPLDRKLSRTAEGEHVELSIRPTPTLPGGWAVMVREVTEAVRAEGLARAIAMVEGSGVLLAGICHELHDPLASLTGLVSMLEAEAPQQAALVRQMRLATARMDGLLASLRVPRGTEALALESLVLAGELERLLPIAAVEAAARGVTLGVEVDASWVVRADRRALFQVLHNLLANAFHALEGVSGATLEVRARSFAGEVELEVRDNGAGMSPSQCSRAFQAFETTRAQGTGMGLFLVRSLMESMGGRVSLTSSPGSGTTVSLRFVSPPPAPFDASAAAKNQP